MTGHICGFLRDAAWLKDIDREIFLDEAGSRTVGKFRRRVAALAETLRDETGLCVGCRVAVLGYTTMELLEVMIACLSNGWTLVPFNYRWSLKETLWTAHHVSPSLLLYDTEASDVAQRLEEAIPGMRIQSIPQGQLAETHFTSLELHRPGHDVAMICFTSGTTGKPKGVMLTHQALLFQNLYKKAICGYAYGDVYLHTAPLFHIGGWVSAMAMTAIGAKQFFTKRFNPLETARLIKKHGVTTIIAVPAMLTDLSKVENATFSTIRNILIGGGGASQNQAEAVAKLFPNTMVRTAYGMTETGSSLAYYGPVTAAAFAIGPRPAGFAIPGTRISLAPQSVPRTSLSVAQIATTEAFDSDGWFRTGDIGRFDENGALILLGRRKEMIKSGGENIYPVEIEAVLAQHPAIAEVAVVGIPHPRFDETPCANIVLKQEYICRHDTTDRHIGVYTFDTSKGTTRPTIPISPTALRDFCAQHGLSRFKLPTSFVFQYRPLPKSSTGKVLKREICEIMLVIISGNRNRVLSKF